MAIKQKNEVQENGPSYVGTSLMSIPGAFGSLRSSKAVLGRPEVLRERMEEDGYLFLPGLLDSAQVQAARDSITRLLDEEGLLHPEFPRDQAVARPGVELHFRPDLATGNEQVERLLYDGAMMDFWKNFFGDEVLHFDFTWLRAKAPASRTVTEPHCDTVFMNRGTPRLFTAWTPLGEVPYDNGGLMVLEGSHRRADILGDYWKMDVDTYCSNGEEAREIETGERNWQSDKNNGMFDEDAVKLQKQLAGRWLGAEYRSGDVLVFGMHTLHAAADNRTDRIRLSTDSRYQRADEPTDERWIGPEPVGHGPNAKKGMIC